MKLWKVGSVGMFAMALGFSVYQAGCSSDPPVTGPTPGQPPGKPSGPATTDTSTKTFAISKLYLGEARRALDERHDDRAERVVDAAGAVGLVARGGALGARAHVGRGAGVRSSGRRYW